MKIGAQLYTLRDFLQTEKDMEYTLEKVSQMGYEVVQVSGVGPIDPKIIRSICDKNNLKIVLTHSNPDRVLNDTDKLIEEHNILGADYVGIGGIPGKYRDEKFIQRFAEDYLPAAEKIKAAGKLFMYHNHDFEFAKLSNGKYMLDVILDEISSDLMGLTLDTFWVQKAGCDVIEWLERLQDRIPCVHLKDMATTYGAREQIMAPVFEGNMNFDGILKKLVELGKTKYALVEQDRCVGSAFDAIETSYKNLVARGYK